MGFKYIVGQQWPTFLKTSLSLAWYSKSFVSVFYLRILLGDSNVIQPFCPQDPLSCEVNNSVSWVILLPNLLVHIAQW